MFGRGQLQNGVIIDPSQDFIFDPKDSSLLANFRDAIWRVLGWADLSPFKILTISFVGPQLSNLTPMHLHIPDYSKKYVADKFYLFLRTGLILLIR
jgi:hypothetical protein